jgi:hypothetical protein
MSNSVTNFGKSASASQRMRDEGMATVVDG